MLGRTAGLILAGVIMSAGPSKAAEPTALGVMEQWLESDFGIIGTDALPATDSLQAAAEAARSEAGPDSSDYAAALAKLGVTLSLGGAHLESLPYLYEAVRVLRRTEGIFSRDLIAPYFFMGLSLQAVGAHDTAEDALSQAQLIVQRTHGNNSEQQLPIIYARARSAHLRGDLEAAEGLHRYAYSFHRSAFGPTSPETIAAADRLGRWLASIGNSRAAVLLYRTAMDELSEEHDADPPEMLPLLRGRADAYLGGRFPRRSFGMHERIIALMEDHPQEFSRDERIAALIEFGDLQMRYLYERSATRRYIEAWRVADEGGADYEHWKAYLGQPQLVRFGTLIPTEHGDGVRLSFDFEFDVSDYGRPQDIQLLSEVSDRVESYVPELFREQVRFRPSIVGGAAVHSAGHSISMAVDDSTSVEPHPGLVLRTRGPGSYLTERRRLEQILRKNQ